MIRKQLFQRTERIGKIRFAADSDKRESHTDKRRSLVVSHYGQREPQICGSFRLIREVAISPVIAYHGLAKAERSSPNLIEFNKSI